MEYTIGIIFDMILAWLSVVEYRQQKVFPEACATILPTIHSPEDLKKIPEKQLPYLAREIRRKIIEVVSMNGGHLASNLGVVELTIALHRVFDSPDDALVWDVSHQCYAHKLLTGRYKQFDTLRQHNGLSGFTRSTESPHDFFNNGHASTSISSALGLLTAWNLRHKDGKVVAIIGDGALTGGMAMEALSQAGQISKNLIVVLNDNQMSIGRNTGAISRYLSRLTMSSHYQSLRYLIDKAVDRIPYLNKHLGKFIFRLKRGLKGLFLTNNLFVDLGFEYVGPLNGHDEHELELVLRRVRKLPRPVVVHVVTKKGRGYVPAEDNPTKFHGIGPFCISDGTVEKFDTVSFTQSFTESLMETAHERNDIVCITAAMANGTGLSQFAKKYPSRFFDVGIAEEHAVTFAGGLAKGGLLPIVCIYSTFIQRAVDQIIHDVSLPDVHVIFILDRAGVVPADGETHQGMFDIALLRPVPHMTLLCPAGAADLDRCLKWAVGASGPVAIRYPKMTCPTDIENFSEPVGEGRGILIPCTDFAPSLAHDEVAGRLPGIGKKRILFVCTGGMYSEVLTAARTLVMKNIRTDIYSLRFIKPLDESYFISIVQNYEAVVFVEDGVQIGGISEYLAGVLLHRGFTNISVKAFPDRFLAQGTRAEICQDANMSPDCLAEAALQLLASVSISVGKTIKIHV